MILDSGQVENPIAIEDAHDVNNAAISRVNEEGVIYEEGEIYGCGIHCDFEATNLLEAIEHRVTTPHFLDDLEKCIKCGMKFSSRGNVDRHQIRVHNLRMRDDRAQRFSSDEVFNPGASQEEHRQEEQRDHHVPHDPDLPR